ncbi:hypothetical protein EJB05_14942, partial [Eragrostis curvula]
MSSPPGPGDGIGGGSAHGIFGASGISGFGYGVGVAIGILLIVSTIALAVYFCTRTSMPVGTAVAFFAPHPPPPRAGGEDVEQGGIDEATLEAFPPAVAYAEARKQRPAAQQACCPVCLENYADADVVRALPDCGHLFHRECVDPWLRLRPTCPVCRTSPLPSPMPTPLAEVTPLASARRASSSGPRETTTLHKSPAPVVTSSKPFHLPLQVPDDLRYGDDPGVVVVVAASGAQPRDEHEVPELPGIVGAAEVGVHHPVHGTGEPGLLHPPHQLAVAARGLPRHQLQHQHAVLEHQLPPPLLHLACTTTMPSSHLSVQTTTHRWRNADWGTGGFHEEEAEPVAVAFGEAVEPDDVAVVEAAQQLHLQVEVAPVLALAGARPPDRRDQAAGEARPVCRAAGGAGRLEGRGEAVGGRLHLPHPEPPHEWQST